MILTVSMILDNDLEKFVLIDLNEMEHGLSNKRVNQSKKINIKLMERT